jgi:hypothetical protein
MIKSLSPYYVSIPFVSPLTGLTCTAFTLRLYVWNGLKGSPPATPTYEITKTNPTSSTGNDKINIARLVNDFIDFTAVSGATGLIDGQNQQWVKWDTLYETTNPLDATTPSNTNTQLMLQGYNYGLDGENAQPPTNKILIPIIDYKVNRNGFFNIPILIDEPEPPIIDFTLDSITNDSVETYDFAYTKSFESDSVELLYKEESESTYVALDIISDISNVIKADLLSIGEGTFDFILRGYDAITNQTYETESLQTTITYPTVVLNSVTNVGGSNYEYNYTLSIAGTNASLSYKQTSDSIYTLAGSGTFTSGVNTSDATIPITGSVDFRVVVDFGDYGLLISNVITLSI